MEDMPENDREPTDPMREDESRGEGDEHIDDDHRADPDPEFDAELRELEAEADIEPPRELPARISRQARMGRFLALGAIVGLLLSVVLTLLWPEDPNFVAENPDVQFTALQVFGFLAIYIIPVSIGVFGLLGYILGRRAEKRTGRDITIARDDDE